MNLLPNRLLGGFFYAYIFSVANIENFSDERKYDQTEFISFGGQLEQIYEEFIALIESNFIKVDSQSWTEMRQVATKFGYKIEEDTYMFSPIKWDKPRLKWGFTQEKMKVMGPNEFNDHYLIADRESMNSIVNESFKNREPFMTMVIAKMKLCDITHVMNREDDLFFHISYDESCVSKTKNNSVSHIYLTPTVIGGTVVENK